MKEKLKWLLKTWVFGVFVATIFALAIIAAFIAISAIELLFSFNELFAAIILVTTIPFVIGLVFTKFIGEDKNVKYVGEVRDL